MSIDDAQKKLDQRFKRKKQIALKTPFAYPGKMQWKGKGRLFVHITEALKIAGSNNPERVLGAL